MPKYLVKQGLDYPPNRRAEIGDVVDDLPAKSIKWLREQGVIVLLGSDGKPQEDVVEPVNEGEDA